MSLEIIRYNDTYQEKWDRFIEKESMNGTFLQTRKFIEYHPKERFKDCSLIVVKGNQIVSCILACEMIVDDKLTFFSHKGTSFGGLIISNNIYNATDIAQLMDVLDEYLRNNDYKKAYFKMPPSVLIRKNTDLLDYFFFYKEYQQYSELNYYLELDDFSDNILKNFSASKRRDYRYSLRKSLRFKKLDSSDEIMDFYGVLTLNLSKLGLTCVHTLEELLDIKFNRFSENVEFYGVYFEDKMIAGSMTFIFDQRIMHTQYLASNKEYLEYYPMDFLIYNLIEVALTKQMKRFTFGICTENEGKYINMGLSRFKEGFGTEYCVNRTYYKFFD